ncbi:cadmium-translocating P-type ATPase [Patescibacteria group bacterium]|nr:cadmium-translocating P-type ATPase [Patescibacteria group bacterium]
MNTKTFRVRGMHCASCQAIITKKVQALAGVKACDVNFATENATVHMTSGEVPVEQINKELKPLGYQFISQETTNQQGVSGEHDGMDHSDHAGINQSKQEKMNELEQQKERVLFVLPIALLVFGLMMWDIAARLFQSIPNLPLPMDWFNVLFFILATITIFWAGKPFIQGAVTFFRYGVANMDSLIGIGTLSAYLYSASITLIPGVRGLLQVPEHTYFDVTIVVIGFVLLGKYLEARSKLHTGEAIEKLLGLQAKTALVIRDGEEREIPVDQVQPGEQIRVKPGMKIPVDGMILEGRTSIDESMMTGESIPVDKREGDAVIGSTINKQGSIIMSATKIGADTVLSQIISMVQRAQGSKAPIQALADRISGVFVPIVLVIAVLSFILWVAIGSSYWGFSTAFSFGLLAFVGVLVIACPCALGLATPTAIIVGVGRGAEYGMLIKDAESLERLSKVTTVVFDKTGTITRGTPDVTDLVTLDAAYDEQSIVILAASLEAYSEHPLAQAIVRRAGAVPLHSVTDFKAHEGVGIEGVVQGNRMMIRKPLDRNASSSQHVRELQSEGKTVVVVCVEDKEIGLIAISDTVKEGAKDVIRTLHRMGLKTVMLTGDNERTGASIAAQVGIEMVLAEVMPQEKANKIKELQQAGQYVVMVGDGINDAPALVQADVGMAMATGTDVAIESAGMTILGGDITKIPQAITLARLTMRTVRQNLFWAFIYNLIGIPLASGILYPFLGLLLNPVFAGLAMAFSSVSVISNSLRLKTKKL